MIRNGNEALKHLDELQRWENEGGCLGPFAKTDRESHRDDYSTTVSDSERDFIPAAIDCAMSDRTFVEQLTRRSCRVDREVHWGSAT